MFFQCSGFPSRYACGRVWLGYLFLTISGTFPFPSPCFPSCLLLLRFALLIPFAVNFLFCWCFFFPLISQDCQGLRACNISEIIWNQAQTPTGNISMFHIASSVFFVSVVPSFFPVSCKYLFPSSWSIFVSFRLVFFVWYCVWRRFESTWYDPTKQVLGELRRYQATGFRAVDCWCSW